MILNSPKVIKTDKYVIKPLNSTRDTFLFQSYEMHPSYVKPKIVIWFSKPFLFHAVLPKRVSFLYPKFWLHVVVITCYAGGWNTEIFHCSSILGWDRTLISCTFWILASSFTKQVTGYISTTSFDANYGLNNNTVCFNLKWQNQRDRNNDVQCVNKKISFLMSTCHNRVSRGSFIIAITGYSVRKNGWKQLR
jgi:hypothetical protein